jgi:hypothetical protein
MCRRKHQIGSTLTLVREIHADLKNVIGGEFILSSCLFAINDDNKVRVLEK